jgi:large conductance mechanosensitive channel
MGVGIIIGAAFGKIVSSFVADVIMPPLGLLIGGINFSDLAVTLKTAIAAGADKPAVTAVTLNYGKFIQTTVDFTIVAFAIFVVIKGINYLKRKEEAKQPEKQVVTEVAVLTEIRDILKGKR